jgi:hypothetical protein
MLKRVLAGLIGAMNVANGLAMLFDGAGWYARVPGVTDTGPYNPHFVQDIGLAFIVAGGALLARAWRASLWPASFAGAAYLAAHAGLHLVGIGDSHHAAFDVALIVVPSLAALWAATPDREKHHA